MQTGEFFRFWSTLGLRSPTTADIHQSSAFERLKLHLIVRVPKTAEDLPVSPEVYSAGTGPAACVNRLLFSNPLTGPEGKERCPFCRKTHTGVRFSHDAVLSVLLGWASFVLSKNTFVRLLRYVPARPRTHARTIERSLHAGSGPGSHVACRKPDSANGAVDAVAWLRIATVRPAVLAVVVHFFKATVPMMQTALNTLIDVLERTEPGLLVVTSKVRCVSAVVFCGPAAHGKHDRSCLRNVAAASRWAASCWTQAIPLASFRAKIHGAPTTRSGPTRGLARQQPARGRSVQRLGPSSARYAPRPHRHVLWPSTND